MKLVILSTMVIPDVNERHLQAVEQAAREAGVDTVVAGTTETQVAAIKDADIAFGGITEEVFLQAKQLKWIQSIGAGVDRYLTPAFVESGVVLTSEKGLVGTHLAEHAFAHLLALTRGINTAIRQKDWNQRVPIRLAAWELTGRTMGVIGMGGTGVEVARRAHAFGMRVIATDPEPVERPPFVEAIWGPDRFHDLLRQSDAVVVTAPHTAETRGMFDLEAFRAMPRHVILVNVSRGEIVNMDAVIQALREGLIAGAGLDVTPKEPLPLDNPLWSMENVIITFHTAGASPYRGDRIVERFRRNLGHFLKGEPLEGVIDKRKGY
jgi:phosphoglycerate dehydrogenase-like enzyme